MTLLVVCGNCRGSGRVNALACATGQVCEQPCRDCDATGRLSRERVEQIARPYALRVTDLEKKVGREKAHAISEGGQR